MRLNKFIASAGVCSRRKADEYILDGKIKINGQVVTQLGVEVDEAKDIVEFDSKVINIVKEKVYIMLNKPEGYVTTAKDQFSRDSVLDLIDEDIRVFPVGRLDMYTEGLLFLTNDGDFANKLMHPKNKIKKVYIAKIKGEITDKKLENLRKGVDIDDYITMPAKVELVGKNKLKFIITEGKNRQIRKMCDSQELEVISLKRVQVGNISLDDLPKGKYIFLSKKQIDKI